MAEPATTGQLRTNIADMEIGDYIGCRVIFNNNQMSLSKLGETNDYEISLSGIKYGTASWGLFYLIKADKGLLISDRVIFNYITWDVLNSKKLIQGAYLNQIFSDSSYGDIQGIIRSLTGGVVYADAEGNKSTSDKGFGAWPVNNEWDKYIVNSDLNGTITPGDDNVWHWNGVFTWTQDTRNDSPSNRVLRGYNNSYRWDSAMSSALHSNKGFRPVFEYIEPDGSSKQQTIWY